MARRVMDIPGQMDIFTYMAELPTIEQLKEAENVLSFTSKKEEILSAADEYLKKGERLTSLAREKYAKMVSRLSFSATEKKLFNLNVKSYKNFKLVPKIASGVMRPLLRKLTTYDESDEAYKLIKQLVDFDITIEEVGSVAYENRGNQAIQNGFSVKATNGEELLILTIKEEGYEPLEIYGCKEYAHAKKRKSVLWRDLSATGDIAEALAWMVVISLYNKALVNENLIPLINLKLMEKYPSPQYVLRSALTVPSLNNLCSDKADIREMYADYPAPLGLPMQKYRHPSSAAVEEICKILGYDGEIMDAEYSDDTLVARNKLEVDQNHHLHMYMLTEQLDYAFKYIDPVNWVKTEKGKLTYHDLLNHTIPKSNRAQNDPDFVTYYWPLPKDNMTDGPRRVLYNVDEVMEIVFEDYKKRLEKLEFFKERSSRARVWDTKKNIPEKVLKAARESIFNEGYFGFVEFDEETDLEKVAALADEFVAFKETYLKALDTSNVSIRFRKLGNYKAAGLYCFNIGCLCVDFRHPDSFVHEYGHCIDSVMGGDELLSDGADFRPVYEEYERAFRRFVSDSGISLKGKYNEKYFLRETEVFARSMEMYVTRTLGMKNSICKPDEEMSFAYPKDEKMMEKINEYFSLLFESLNTVDEEVAA